MGSSLELVICDGVAIAHAGDTVIVVYAADARLHRTRWLFDRIDELVARTTPISALMIVPPSADIPDAQTRAENTRRMADLRGHLRRVVTVIVGDSMRINLVRTVMRAIFLLQGQTRVQSIVCSVEEGVEMLVSDPTPDMPRRSEILATLHEISTQLQCSLA